jgi:hypothetical protein
MLSASWSEPWERTPRGVGPGRLLVVVVVLGGAAGLDDVERETALELHAGGAENRAEGACCASLLADYFADVGGRNVKAKDGGVLIGYNLYLHGVGIVYQGPGNLGH